jgi:hypothetical protein
VHSIGDPLVGQAYKALSAPSCFLMASKNCSQASRCSLAKRSRLMCAHGSRSLVGTARLCPLCGALRRNDIRASSWLPFFSWLPFNANAQHRLVLFATLDRTCS